MASRFLKLEKAEESFKLPSFLLHDKKVHSCSDNEKKPLNNCNATTVLEIRILHLLKSVPNGIQIERFNKEYEIMYKEDLIPSDYGFDDLVDLLKSLSQIVSIAVEGKYDEIKLYAKNVIEDKDLDYEIDSFDNEDVNLDFKMQHNEKKFVINNLQKINKKLNAGELPASAKLPSKVLNVFNTILESHDGGIDIDALSSEYKYRTGKELKPSSWGFNSILDMLSKLSDIFTICKFPNGKFILCTASTTEAISKKNEILKNSIENSVSCASVSVSDRDEDVKFSRKLPSEAQKRLKSLLEDYFPNGLELNEIVGAYRGFYGATLDDFDPMDYGYLSLEAFLRAHSDLLTVQSYGNTNHQNMLNVQSYGNTIMVFPSGDMKDVCSIIEFPLPACCIVSLNESYTKPNYDVSMKNTEVDFVIGEVSSPSKFHVMLQGEHSSEALNALMDQMLEFYDSPISKRYEVNKESMLSSTKVAQVPVVARYSEDLNWYRAIIIKMTDNYVAKLFLVDYGTTCTCSYTDLRLIHQKFFMLPAQAIRASLFGVIPCKDSKSWSKTSSKTFKCLVQNKYLHSRVHDVSDGLIISLCDDNNVNINELLVARGYACWEDGSFPIDFGSSVENVTTLSTSENIENANDKAYFNNNENADTREQHFNSLSDQSYNIHTNDKELIQDKVISLLKKVEINENFNTLLRDSEANMPQERIDENIYEFSTVSLEALENDNLIKTEGTHHNYSSDVDQLDYSNIVSRNNSQYSVILEDGAQSIVESLKKRKVEVMKIKDHSIHIIYLSGERYMLSSEISRLIWGSDELQDQLKRMEVDVPYINLQHDTHADIFKQLSSFGVKDILGANNQVLMTVTIYPVDTAFKILNIFKYKDLETMTIIKNIKSELLKTSLK